MFSCESVFEVLLVSSIILFSVISLIGSSISCKSLSRIFSASASSSALTCSSSSVFWLYSFTLSELSGFSTTSHSMASQV